MRPWLPLVLLLAPGVAQAAGTFALTSSAFTEGGTLAKPQVNATERCGSGGDLSPPLAWSAPPAGTKAFAVTLFDPDGHGGKGWWHWALFDLPPDTHALEEDAGKPGNPPEGGGQSALNSFGTAGYGGACPPPGESPHHYVFTVWAVGEDKLSFDAGSKDEEVGAWLAAHALGKATITARYGR